MRHVLGVTTASPYADAWTTYADRGWCPIPLPADAKYPPPDGVTGDRGRPPTRSGCAAWATEGYDAGRMHVNPPHNIGVRLNGDTIGLDVDHYGDKTGADTLAALEAEHGPLPLTWSSTSRGATSPSRIYFYRVPDGTRLRAAPGPSIEAIQRHHRYAVVWPSIHPKTGEQYQWFDDAGEQADHPPTLDDLAELPWAWIEGLRSIGGPTAEAAAPEHVAEFMAATGEQKAPYRLDGIRTRLDATPPGTSRHDTLIEVACWAMREAAAGCYTANAAEAELRQWWDRVMDDQGRRYGTEFGDAIAWAVAQARLDPERLERIRTDSTRADDGIESMVVKPSSAPQQSAPIAPAEEEPAEPPTPIQPIIDEIELPPWPVHTLPGWVRDHVTATAERLQVPVDLCAQLALGALSSVTMGHVTVSIDTWHEPTNLYTYVAMHSGAGKSPAEKAMVGPLREWEATRRKATDDDYRVQLAKWKVAQKKLRKDEDGAANGSVSDMELAASVLAASGERPAPYRLTIDDATPERLVQLLAQHRRLALISTEAGLLDMVGGQLARNGATNIDVYLKAWAGETIQRDRKGGEEGPETTVVNDALLSVVLTIQPSVIDKYQATSPELRGRGFFARFMPAVPRSLVGTRTYGTSTPPGPEADAYRSGIEAFADKLVGCQGVHLHPDTAAGARFYAWCEDMERQLLPGARLSALHDAASKIRSSVLRVAAILSAADGRWRDIDEPTMAAAIEIGNYWVEHARYVEGAVDPLGTDNAYAAEMAAAIVEWCRRKNTLEVTPREVYLSRRRSLKLRGVDDLAAGFEHLQARGWLTFSTGSVDLIGVQRAEVRARLRAEALTGFTVGVDSTTESALTRAKDADRLIGEKASSSLYTPVEHPLPGPPPITRTLHALTEEPDSDPVPVDNSPVLDKEWL